MASGSDSDSEGVEDFGQEESLADRIKGLLKAYHGELDLVTELLQNADDAFATKLHLVLDVGNTINSDFEPKYPFGPQWKQLHGSALLAWNNSTFSEDDFKGIQRLGTGSKREALMKKGRFGVGANIMYLVTDCPAFISDNLSLSIFDPCRHFTRTAQRRRLPGARLLQAQMQCEKHKEIYRKFHIDDNHPLRGATVFRLALPPPGTKPKIADESMTVQKIVVFFNKVLADEGECLLFLQSVRELKLLLKDENGVVAELYGFRVEISDQDERRLKLFFEHCAKFENIRKAWVEGQPEPTNELKAASIVYESELIVSKKGEDVKRSKWLVCQQIGYSKPCSPRDKGLIQQCSSIKLLPLAGLATRFDGGKVKGSVFSGLPLQVDSGIPFHINGHFALDNEGRKTLFTSRDAHNKESTWNRQLFTRVLPTVYVRLLVIVKEKFFSESEMNTKTALERLDMFYNLFPRPSTLSGYQASLAEDVLREIIDHKLGLFVSLNRLQRSQESVSLQWFSLPTSAGSSACFTSLDWNSLNLMLLSYKVFRAHLWNSIPSSSKSAAVLLNLNAKLLYCPPDLTSAFGQLQTISWFSTDYACKHLTSICGSWQLPKPVAESPLEDAGTVEALSDYCLKPAPHDSHREMQRIAEGLPLLLANNGVLHSFHLSKPFFADSCYYSLFEDSPFYYCKFVQPFGTQLIEAGFLKAVAASNISELLVSHSLLPEFIARLRSGGDTCANRNESSYVCRLWKYLITGLNSGKFKSKALLKHLGNWRLLPVISANNGPKKLAPLSILPSVLNATSSSGDNEFFARFLPTLDRSMLLSETASGQKLLNESDMRYFEKLCCMVQSGTSILSAFIDSLAGNWDKVSKNDRFDLLRFIIRNQNAGFNSSLVKGLPIFPTISKTCQSISGCNNIYFLSDESEIHNSSAKDFIEGSDCIFLELLQEANCEAFYKNLGAKELTWLQLYVNFIVPRFSELNVKSQVLHLQFIMAYFWQNADASNWSLLKSKLQTQNFILRDINDRVKPMDLYSDNLIDFQRFLPNLFLPNSYKATIQKLRLAKQLNQWFQFLAELGLKSELKVDHVKSIAHQLEAEGRLNGCLNNEEVKCFVSEIYRSNAAATNLKAIWHANIFECEAIENILSEAAELLPYFPSLEQKSKGSIHSISECCSGMFAAIAWTCQPILPDWALPYGKHSGLKPTLSTVLQHAQTFFSTVTAVQFLKFAPVITKIATEFYHFINDVASEPIEPDKIAIRMALTHLPFVVIVSKTKISYVRASLTCLDDEDLDWSPYLHKLPNEFHRHATLFRLLGMTSTRSIEQCCEVLAEVRRQWGSKPIERLPIRWLVEMVVEYMIERIDPTNWKEITTEQELWLPNDEFIMLESSRLMFLDLYTRFCAETITKDNSFRGRWLHGFTFVENGQFETFAKALPSNVTHLKPKCSSDVLRELRDATAGQPCKLGQNCGTVSKLTKAFTTEQLWNAIAELVSGKARRAFQLHKTFSDVSATCLQNAKIVCVDDLQTFWKLTEGKSSPTAPRKVKAFVDVDDDGGGELVIFVQHNADNSEKEKYEFYLDLSARLSIHVGGVDQFHLFTVILISAENADDANSMQQVVQIARMAKFICAADIVTSVDCSRKEQAVALLKVLTEQVAGISGTSLCRAISAVPDSVPEPMRLPMARAFAKQGAAWLQNAKLSKDAGASNDFVLFACHQTAEFLVKAVGHYQTGEQYDKHDIRNIAASNSVRDKVCLLMSYGCNYIDTRYPDRYAPQAPCEVHKTSNVKSALQILESIYDELTRDYGLLF